MEASHNRNKGYAKEMLLIELFSGTGSVGKVARRRGWKVISVDSDPAHKPTYVADVLRLPYKSLPVPDFVVLVVRRLVTGTFASLILLGLLLLDPTFLLIVDVDEVKIHLGSIDHIVSESLDVRACSHM